MAGTNSTVVRSSEPSGQPHLLTWITDHVTATAITILLVSLTTCFIRVKKYRNFIRKTNGSLKMLPQSMALGTIPSMAKMYAKSPSDAHPHVVVTSLQRENGLDNVFFLDNWPIARPQLCIADPEVAAQVAQIHVLPKAPEIERHVGHLCGPTSMLYTDGEHWKKVRRLFNPGFAVSHLMTLIPGIVDNVAVYCKVLDKYTDLGKVVQMEGDLACLTMNVMAQIVLDHDLKSLTESNELVLSFQKAIEWSPKSTQLNPLVTMNPLHSFMRWYYGRRMDKYIGDVLDARYASKAMHANINNKRKPAIDLALDENLRESQGQGKVNIKNLDPTFRAQSIDQMKTFLFAGHDSTSSTMCYIYHLLSGHPEAAAKVREEHDEVFGNDWGKVGDLLKQDASIINKLPYSTAVIKETLRLYPPASSIRQGQGSSFTYKGETYDTTKDMMVWIVSHSIHRRADLFPSPDDFIPERFLPAPDNWQEIPKDAWRPFEKGPRNCIGQELAMLELKIIMAMTCRQFDVQSGYTDWDRKMGRESPGDILGGKRGMFGDRAYQILIAGAKPADGFPGLVKRRAA